MMKTAASINSSVSCRFEPCWLGILSLGTAVGCGPWIDPTASSGTDSSMLESSTGDPDPDLDSTGPGASGPSSTGPGSLETDSTDTGSTASGSDGTASAGSTDTGSPDPETGWAKIFGDEDEQLATMIAADALANVYLVGGIHGTTSFGGTDLTSAGDADAFIAKLDSDGNHLWSRSFGGEREQMITDVEVDSAGNVLVTGYHAGDIDFGGGPLPVDSAYSYSGFIAKLDPAGNHLWSVQYGTAAQQEQLRGIAVDPADDVIVTGYFGSAPDANAFIGKFSGADGSPLWAAPIYGTGNEQIFESLATDAAGNVLVAGQLEGFINVGGLAATSLGANDVFVTKLDSSGSVAWLRSFGDGADQYPGAVVVDSQGSPVIVGAFEGQLSFDGQGDLVSAGDYDVFVVKLSPDGEFEWSRSFGDAQRQASIRAAIDESDELLLTGEIAGIVDFGGGPLHSAGDADLFLVRLDAAGNHLSSRRFGDSDRQLGRGVAFVPDLQGVYVMGQTTGTTDFGVGRPLVSAGDYDIVLARLEP